MKSHQEWIDYKGLTNAPPSGPSYYLEKDEIADVIASTKTSIDENNVIEIFDKDNVFTKKPMIAKSPEARYEDLIRTKEMLETLVSLNSS